MAGTPAGGKLAAATNKRLHGEDFYVVNGRLGGMTPSDKPKGFAANRELARTCAAIGGRISKRRKKE